MGGHDAGEVAARLALAGLAEAVEAIPQGGLGEPSLREAILAAHARVAACGAETGKPDMGCTLTGCIFGDGGAWAFNVGDSRCYLLQRGFARQITVDHSANSLPGLQSLGRNVIYSCIGGRYSPAQIDIFPLTPSLEPGIVFILCSDGFHEFAGADEIEAAFLPGPAAVDAPLCASLAAQALAAGSEDNVTVCAIGVF
jgi:protein phosphatase